MIYVQLGEYGNPLCPLPYVEWGYADDDDTYLALPARSCGTDLHLELTTTGPVHLTGRFSPVDMAAAAHCSAWRLICENGHVLAHSTSDETAEPFDASLLLTVIDPAGGDAE